MLTSVTNVGKYRGAHALSTDASRCGYTVTTAGDGLAGLEMFRQATPEVLLLDVMLPGLDGIGLCRRVRETSTCPILMMSAHGEALDVVSGLEVGADDYVIKPVDTAVLVARIRSVLRRSGYSGHDGDSRVVDLCVQRLRRKIGAPRIETVRGFGYKRRWRTTGCSTTTGPAPKPRSTPTSTLTRPPVRSSTPSKSHRRRTDAHQLP